MDQVFNNSDHNYIRFTISENLVQQPLPSADVPRGWNTSGGIDVEALHTGLLIAEWLDGGPHADSNDAESGALSLRSRIISACDFSLPRRRAPKSGKPPVHWWNTEISNLRAECVRAKRKKVRMVARVARLRQRANADFDNDRATSELERTNSVFVEAKRRLKHAISRSKKACWGELIASVDQDPFGKPYRMVMRKLRGPPATATMEPETLKTVVSTLFPTHQQRQAEVSGQPVVWEPFTQREVDCAVTKFKGRNKAPGPDGITTKIIWAVHRCDPGLLLRLYNACLRSGTFPEQWKESRVVLLRKGDKPEGVPSSYRPLCLLNDLGKVLEHLLAQRLEAHVKARGGLARNQFGFRSGMSTDDAVRLLDERIVMENNRGNYCLAVAIDIKNASNSAKWSDIMEALHAWETSRYLSQMFDSYFSRRSGSIESRASPGGKLEVCITGGVPQGSVVGPLLWNITYNSVIKEELPGGCATIGFADDTMVVVAAKTIPDLEVRANRALEQIATAISNLSLEIAADKTEAVLFTYRYKYAIPDVRVCGKPIKLTDQLTYLGIVIDKSRLFKAHIKKATEKADRVGASLARLMLNVGGPRGARRQLLASVVHSVLLYGAPSWAHTLDVVPGNVKLLNKSQRKVLLRKTCAYRTVSEAATNVLAGTPPADLLAREREAEYSRRRSGIGTTANTVASYPTLAAWQRRWDTSETGRWTRTLISNVSSWTGRRFGELNYHLTQFLSGHGCFGTYLYKIQKVETAECVDCGAVMDNAEHVFFSCDRWWRQRRELEGSINNDFTPQTFCGVMLESIHNWLAVSKYVDLILAIREKEERERQRGPPDVL